MNEGSETEAPAAAGSQAGMNMGAAALVFGPGVRDRARRRC